MYRGSAVGSPPVVLLRGQDRFLEVPFRAFSAWRFKAFHTDSLSAGIPEEEEY